MLINRLGIANFVSLNGVEDIWCSPYFLGEQVEVVQRPDELAKAEAANQNGEPVNADE